MGASCCRFSQDNENQYKPICCTSGVRISFHLQSARSGATAQCAHRSRNQSLSSDRDVRHIQRLHDGYSSRPHKIEIIQTQDQQFAPAIAVGSVNQAYEPIHVLESNNDKKASSGCNVKTQDDAHKESKRSDSPLLPITDDEDFCPTCLDGYDKENPKILTKCKHNYHLACILEWMERSNTCPMCDQEMVIDDTC